MKLCFNNCSRQFIQPMMDKFLAKSKKPVNEKMIAENEEGSTLTPWVERYRPNSLNQLSYQTEVTEALKNIVKTGNIPHLLFYGPAGTGKTSAILALAREVFGPKFYRERIIELNASDERGINVIRQKVKKFAQKNLTKNMDQSFSCPKVKIIILDEADLLTNDAQSALRRIIEDNSATTRFCLICNYITKIIQPLASRFIKFRFKSIPSDVQFEKLEEICVKEGIALDRKNLKILVEKGDLRQSINSLQSLSQLTTISQYILPIQDEKCKEIFGLICACSSIRDAYELAEQIGFEGYAIDEILNGIFSCVMELEDEQKKATLLNSLGVCEERLQNGAYELPLIDLFTTIFYVLNAEY